MTLLFTDDCYLRLLFIYFLFSPSLTIILYYMIILGYRIVRIQCKEVIIIIIINTSAVGYPMLHKVAYPMCSSSVASVGPTRFIILNK